MLMYMCMAGPLHSSFQSDAGHLGAVDHHLDVADGIEQHPPSTECSSSVVIDQDEWRQGASMLYYATGERALVCYIMRVEAGR